MGSSYITSRVFLAFFPSSQLVTFMVSFVDGALDKPFYDSSKGIVEDYIVMDHKHAGKLAK